MLIRAAYRMDESSMKGGPAWLDSERYDVAARTATRSSEDQLRLMLQKLLADRFQLRVHRETKEGRPGLIVMHMQNDAYGIVAQLNGGKDVNNIGAIPYSPEDR